MLDRLAKIEQRYEELNQQMALPEVASDIRKIQELALRIRKLQACAPQAHSNLF